MVRLFGFLFLRFWERAALNNFVFGRYAKAEEYFRKIRTVQPNKMGIGHNIGLVCLAQERYEEAEAEFLGELERFGETYIRLKTLGDLYYLWGKRAECAKYYQMALPGCEHEADRKLIQKRIEYASDPDTFEKAMKSYQALKRGNAYMAEKRFEAASEEFERAIQLDPYNFQAWNNRGAVELNYRKNPARAVEYFQRAVEYTSLPAIHNNLKRAQAMLGKEKR
ncbi:MAG: tetratricopeptide repeat protein [Spirochaetes bacterium]|nr:tetratricopeptide repeat protein [Spirochaetota bacterium]